MNNREIRSYAVDGLELRAIESGGAGLMTGHAAVFNTPTEIAGLFHERVAPGAFAESIGVDDVRALFNHDPNYVVGRSKSGTLRLKEDQTGLAIEADLPDTQFARDLATLMRRGDISQMSFGFEVLEEEWNKEGDMPMRTLKKVRLWDVSPVTYPAYPTTDVAVRGLEVFQKSREKPITIDRRWEWERVRLGLTLTR